MSRAEAQVLLGVRSEAGGRELGPRGQLQDQGAQAGGDGEDRLEQVAREDRVRLGLQELGP